MAPAVFPEDLQAAAAGPRRRLFLAGWLLFWALMVSIAVQQHRMGGRTDLWQPLLWEGSSALVASLLMLALWRWLPRWVPDVVPRMDGHLSRPARWFGLALAQVLWVAPVFVAAVYAIRHGIYALVGQGYRHPPWPEVLVQESLRFGLFYALFAAVVFGLRSHGALQAERWRAQQAVTLAREAQLTQLAQQLQPHFLFNALNTIAEVVHQDPVRAEALILRLADLLRAASDLARRPLVPLADELALAEAYAVVLRERFAGRLELTIEADPAAAAIPVPVLSLQPLLENAVVHGVERHPGAAEVRVRAVLEGATRLVLEVRCNRGEVSPQASDGVGLSNLRQRLAASHGAAATLSLEPVASGGSLARLVWPC